MLKRSHSSLVVLALVSSACGSVNDSAPSEAISTSGSALALAPHLQFTPVAKANPKVVGTAIPNVLPPEFVETAVAQGSTPVENPASVKLADGTTVTLPTYGYDGDGPELPSPGDLPTATHKVEASKSDPDKNTYLVLRGQHGADPSYDYGTHFLFAGHEVGQTGYITRINLDADGAHKVTVLASTTKDGSPIQTIDGSTWDPFAKKLIFTTETSSGVSAYQASADFPSVVEPLTGSFGNGGYEGVQNDSDGNVWIVEDVGGPTSTTFPHSKQANSFVYRFVPTHPHDLTKGKLQALQVISLRGGQPIAFHAGQSAADASSLDVGDLHTYGNSFPTKWITIHDTSVDGTAAFDANAAAKAALATPFKRPENGQFRPGSQFTEFYFDETGDTSLLTEVGAPYGGFGSVLKLQQSSPSANEGTLSLVYLGDAAHSGFDNCAFVSRDEIVFVEDAGDGLHAQRNALDSAYVIDVRKDYSTTQELARILAEGRDTSATIDSGFSGLTGFQNEGDNEITGFHVSNGDASTQGILGAQIPHPFARGWRVFYNQQHGDNFAWEILAKPHDDDDH